MVNASQLPLGVVIINANSTLARWPRHGAALQYAPAPMILSAMIISTLSGKHGNISGFALIEDEMSLWKHEAYFEDIVSGAGKIERSDCLMAAEAGGTSILKPKREVASLISARFRAFDDSLERGAGEGQSAAYTPLRQKITPTYSSGRRRRRAYSNIWGMSAIM